MEACWAHNPKGKSIRGKKHSGKKKSKLTIANIYPQSSPIFFSRLIETALREPFTFLLFFCSPVRAVVHASQLSLRQFLG